MPRTPRKKTTGKPAEALAYTTPPSDSSSGDLVSIVARENIVLRMRMIARLELKGLQAPEIARELAKHDKSWQLEAVIQLMGGGTEGTAKERESQKVLYEQVREEVLQPSLVDIDSQITEMQGMAMKALKDLLGHPDAKIRLQASKDILRMGGTDATTVERKIVEIRMKDTVRDSLQAILAWVPPESELKQLMKSPLAVDD